MKRTGEIVDFLLREAGPEERERLDRQLATDPELAIEVAEVGSLLEDMRSLRPDVGSAPPGVPLRDRLWLAARHRAQRISVLRRPQRSGGSELFDVVRVAAVAAIVLTSLIGIRAIAFGGGGGDESVAPDRIARATVPSGEVDPELVRLLDADHIPVPASESAFHGAYRALAERPIDLGESDLPEVVRGWVHADNLLARLREEHLLRSDAEARRAASRAVGGPDVEDRVQQLARTIAHRITVQLETDDGVRVEDAALALRGLLAVGSTLELGEHRATVGRCYAFLADQVGGLHGDRLATALAALSDLAVAEGGEISALVAVHADRLARETLTPVEKPVLREVADGAAPDGDRPAAVLLRPALLHWRASSASLADAGRVFQLAPAFGTHPGLAFRARLMVAAHIDERLARDREQPDVVAAQLYGFGDLIDREAADRRLLLWDADQLVPDYLALHHVAWSRYPARPGWAQFQSQLRRLTGLGTPADTRDASALLLCLSMNFAAPGALEVVLLSQV